MNVGVEGVAGPSSSLLGEPWSERDAIGMGDREREVDREEDADEGPSIAALSWRAARYSARR
jgi:hypothetical protein